MEARLNRFEQSMRSRGTEYLPLPLGEGNLRESTYALEMVEEPGMQPSVTMNAPMDPAANEAYSPDQSETSMGVLAFADEQVSGFFGNQVSATRDLFPEVLPNTR